MLTLGAYAGSDRFGQEAPTFGPRLGARLGYLGQIGPAEVGPILALDYAARSGLPGAVAATLGLQAGFTISKKPRQVPNR
jgi:hypothetical protein